MDKLQGAFWYSEAGLLTMFPGKLLIMRSVGALLGNRLALGRQWLALSGSKRGNPAVCDMLLSSKRMNE